jgi:hypothetical protein
VISGIANSIVVIHRHEWGSLSGIIKRGYLKHTLFTYRWFSQLETSIYRTISSQPRLNTPGGYMLDHKKSYRTTTGWDFLEVLTILNIHECGIAMNCRIDNLQNHQVVTTPSSPSGLARACAQCGPTLPGVACTGPSSGSGVATRSTDDGCLWDRDVLYTIIIQTY